MLAVVVVIAVWKQGNRDASSRVVVAVLLVITPWMPRNQVLVGMMRLVTSDAFTLAAVFAPPAQEAEAFVDPVFSPVYDNHAELWLSQFDEGDGSVRLAKEWFLLIDSPSYRSLLVAREVDIVAPGGPRTARQFEGITSHASDVINYAAGVLDALPFADLGRLAS